MFAIIYCCKGENTYITTFDVLNTKHKFLVSRQSIYALKINFRSIQVTLEGQPIHVVGLQEYKWMHRYIDVLLHPQ